MDVTKQQSSLREIQLLRKINELEIEIKSLKEQIDSKQRKADEDLSLRKIISLMPGNVFWKAKNGSFLGVNNNLANLLGLSSPDEIIGKYNHDLVSLEIATALSEIDKKSMNLEGESFEEDGLDAKGNPATYFTQKHALHNKRGEIIGIIGVSMDITERKKIEKELMLAKERAEASSIAKSHFLAVVNHELRTPLAGILGLVEILKEQLNKLNIPSETLSLIDNVDDCSQYLLAMVNDVLDFSKLEANKTKATLKSANLNSISQQVFNMLDKLASRKNLTLKKEIDTDLPFIFIDEKALSQILVNLINNAIKFTDSGKVTLKISHQLIGMNRLKLIVKVTDTGQGIPADQLDLIFEPFKQLQSTYIRTSSRGGTGLGLTIVKKLVESLDCTISVASKIGQGSTFTFSGDFTISPANNEDLPISTHHSIESERKKVLLVEDDQIVQLVHKHMLNELNCEIHLAQNGKEALSLMDHYDLALIDIGLTDITGFELIKRMREHQNNNNYHFPIVALTGYTGEQIQHQASEVGIDEIINKPISKEKMKEILDSLLATIKQGKTDLS